MLLQSGQVAYYTATVEWSVERSDDVACLGMGGQSIDNDSVDNGRQRSRWASQPGARRMLKAERGNTMNRMGNCLVLTTGAVTCTTYDEFLQRQLGGGAI